jgi:hypothetical protein
MATGVITAFVGGGSAFGGALNGDQITGVIKWNGLNINGWNASTTGTSDPTPTPATVSPTAIEFSDTGSAFTDVRADFDGMFLTVTLVSTANIQNATPEYSIAFRNLDYGADIIGLERVIDTFSGGLVPLALGPHLIGITLPAKSIGPFEVFTVKLRITVATSHLLGDTVFGRASWNGLNINAWNASTTGTSDPTPTEATVSHSVTEFNDVGSSFTNLRADFESTRLEIRLWSTANIENTTVAFDLDFTDLDYGGPIVTMTEISNTFVNGPVEAICYADSIEVHLPGGSISAFQSFEVVYEIQVGIPEICYGDANNDGVVNFNDVTSVLGNWLAICP